VSNTLPIEALKTSFFQALVSHKTILLTAEPGAGKSTRLPLWLLEKGSGITEKIYLLQPRRIAVKSVAQYLAKQLGEPVGQRIGYRLRNDQQVSKNTKLEVVTEGILIQIMQNDPELLGVSLIIIDEFHERSLQADLAFALARDIQQNLRDDLILLLMSATLANEHIQQVLPDAYYLHCKGRSFPVKLDYQPATNIRLWREHTLSVIKKSLLAYQGSILVFLPGSADIRYFAENLQHLIKDCLVCPLYGDLSLTEQQHAIAKPKNDQRKVVLATNIAETSLTIEGISVVIDTGLEKVAIYDEQILTNTLIQRNIAKSSAIQRTGRAGRLSAGHCIRLYGQEDFQRRQQQNPLDIHQADILPVIIEAARWGVKALNELPLLDFPKALTEEKAWLALQEINVLDRQRRLTQHGEQTVQLSCHPRFAHMIIKAKQLEHEKVLSGLGYLACLIAALLEERDVFSTADARLDCDLRHRITLLLSKHKTYRHQQIIKQAKRLASKTQLSPQTELPLQYCGVLLFLAYPQRLAKTRLQFGEYIASYGKGLIINEQDVMANESVIVAAHLTSFKQKLTVRLAAPVDIQQLLSWGLVETSNNVYCVYDTKIKRIVAAQQQCIGAIILNDKPFTQQLDNQKVFTLWRQQLELHSIAWLNWSLDDKALLKRWRWINQTQAHLDFPNVSEQALELNLELWLLPFIDGITTKAKLDKLNLSEQLLSLLDYQQQQLLNKIAPSHFVGPTGRRCPIRYSNEQAPIVSLPMQEVYGLKTGPVVGDKKNLVPVTIELLSPAQRPIQVTQDLASFWQGSYVLVQKEMKAKYPKHYWPDDPVNAQATRRTKKHLNI